MKKRLLLLAVLLTAALTTAQAQIRFGVKAGLNLNTSDVKKVFHDGEIGTHDNPVGYHFGLQARIETPVLGLYIQPELLYNSNTTRFNYIPTVKTDNYFKVRKTDLDLPVLVGFKILLFRINAGPVFKVNLNEKVLNKRVSQLYEVKSSLKNKYVGYQAGIGLDLMSLTFDIRYNGNFGKTTATLEAIDRSSSALPAAPTRFKLNQGQVTFSLGYMF